MVAQHFILLEFCGLAPAVDFAKAVRAPTRYLQQLFACGSATSTCTQSCISQQYLRERAREEKSGLRQPSQLKIFIE